MRLDVSKKHDFGRLSPAMDDLQMEPDRHFPVRRLAPALLLVLLLGLAPVRAQELTFTDATAEAGIVATHGYVDGVGDSLPLTISGGVAAGDYDRDGFVDLYFVQGDLGPGLLFRNRGDGTFEEVGAAAGVAIEPGLASGPVFGDANGDGWLDLVIGGVVQTQPRLFVNQGDGTFLERTEEAGLVMNRQNTFGGSFGDYDRDGDLDLFLAHWGQFENCTGGECKDHLWRNEGDGTFTSVDDEAGISVAYQALDWSFSPNFSDMNNDGWPDLVISGDFGTSEVFRNDGDGGFTRTTDPQRMTDENGMGAAVADFDWDGDLDWFISSIWGPQFGKTGNRLYMNNGGMDLEDLSVGMGDVRAGLWGWGACAIDFDHDGDLDIFHTNGFTDTGFADDPSRMFMNDGAMNFTDRAHDFGLGPDVEQGKGVVCFDYDRDGDVDILVQNNSAPPRLWRNDSPKFGHFLFVELHQPGANVYGVGGRIYVTSGGVTRLHELRMGSNFSSQDPTEAHFGLAEATTIDEMSVIWPDGVVSTYAPVAVDKWLRVERLYGTPETTLWQGPTPLPADACGVCKAEATLELKSTGPGATQAGLVGWIDGAGGRAAALLDATNDRVIFRQWVAGELVAEQVVATTIDEATAYDLGLTFDGQTFRVRLDGVQVVSAAKAAGSEPFGTTAVVTRNAGARTVNLAVTTVVVVKG